MGIHPGIERLIEYCQGELSPADRLGVDQHLKFCEACRTEVARMQSVSRPEPSTIDPILGGILSEIRNLEAKFARPENSAEVVHRVEKEVVGFLGRQATKTLLGHVALGGENLISTIEPVLSLFLGNRAASKLVDHVVDRAIARI